MLAHKAAGFPQIKQIEEREHVQHKPSPFCKLLSISEVASYHFYCILFVRRESLDPAYTQGEETTQGHEYQEAGIFGLI